VKLADVIKASPRIPKQCCVKNGTNFERKDVNAADTGRSNAGNSPRAKEVLGAGTRRSRIRGTFSHWP
jgi:hypothetical protein